MKTIKTTLLTEGSSDRALLNIIRWCIREARVPVELATAHADLRNLLCPPSTLRDKIRIGLKQYPCDILFVHSDADNVPRKDKVEKIRKTIEELRDEHVAVPEFVCLIPVRELEAWLLFDERLIRKAASNSSDRRPLNLPKLSSIERLADPKARLHELIREASGKTGRRLKQLNISQAVQRIAELADDFSPLRKLRAFQEFESELSDSIRRLDLQ